MKLRPCSAQARIIAIAVATTLLGLGSLSSAHAQTQTQTQTQTAPVQKGTSMSAHAAGPFDVKLAPQSDDKVGDPTVGRMSIDKQYHGDLEAISKGQMLTAMTEIKGSAGYVAIERGIGKLHGREGTLVLQHSGVMTCRGSNRPSSCPRRNMRIRIVDR